MENIKDIKEREDSRTLGMLDQLINHVLGLTRTRVLFIIKMFASYFTATALKNRLPQNYLSNSIITDL